MTKPLKTGANAHRLIKSHANDAKVIILDKAFSQLHNNEATMNPTRNRLRYRDAQRQSNRVCETLESRILLAGDLIAHWVADSLNETVGQLQPIANWADSVVGDAAVAEGTPILVKDRFGGRSIVRFDGQSAFEVPSAIAPLANANDYSVTLVFATDTVLDSGDQAGWFQHTALVDSSTLGLGADWGISIDGNGAIATGMGGGIGQPITSVHSTTNGLNDGMLHVISVIRAGDSLSIYVNDDASPTSVDGANSSPRSVLNMAIGRSLGGGNAFVGDLAQVRFFDGALDSTEIASLHTDLNSYYRNEAPVASDDSYTVAEDTAFFFINGATGLLANDTDTDGDSLEAIVVTEPSHGTVSVNADGSFIYDSDENFFGTDSFTYVANDFRNSNEATVTLNVTPVYDPPVAVPDSYSGTPDQNVSFPSFLGVLVNDENPDRATTLDAVVVAPPVQGSLTLNPDGSFVYDPQGFVGTTTFTYALDDTVERSLPAVVTIVLNTPPEAVADQYEISEDGALVTSAEQGVLANDLDPDVSVTDQVLAAQLVSEPAHGSLTLNANGSFQYSPERDYFGTDSFSYQISDGIDESAIATVNLIVTATNDSPQAEPDSYFVPPGQSLTVGPSKSLLANDVDVDSVNLTASVVTPPTNGELQANADGTFAYQPNPNFQGVDSFAYQVSDGEAVSEVTGVSLFVGVSPVRINEIMAVNADDTITRVRDSAEDNFPRGGEQSPDWIELQNVTAAPIDLGGFHLTDDDQVATKWQFPESTVVPANGYLVVFASGLDVRDAQLDERGWLHTNFNLPSSGDYLAVTDSDGAILDAVSPSYPAQLPNVSYGVSNQALSYLTESTPAAANSSAYLGIVADTQFSHDRGFYNEPISVTLSTASPGAQIRFTTDGSHPSATSGEIYTQPIVVSTTTNLRAAAFLDGFVSTNVDTQTYLFLADVIQQPAEVPGFPVGGRVWAGSNTFVPQDSEMDPEITQDPRYAADLLKGLTDIPTMSITSEGDAIFGNEGWYDGENIESGVSVELIYADDPSRSQQVDAGIESHSHDRLKRSLRLNFRGEYGDSSLNSDLFETAWNDGNAVDEIQRIILRGGNNRSWARIWNPDKTAYSIDEYFRSTQIAMSGFGMRGNYVHLYINGTYWGLYNPVERSDEFYTASYFGGDPRDWFAVNHGGDLSGNDDRFDYLTRELARTDLSDPANYEELQAYLNVEGFADYLILSWWTAVSDWPTNNWYGANRNDSSELGPTPFQFFAWDGEWSWGQGGQSSNNGQAHVHPDFRSNRSGGAPIPLLWHGARNNADFMTTFADRVYKHLYNGGAISESVAIDRWRTINDTLQSAVVAESARWGDSLEAAGQPTRTRDGDWQNEVDRILGLLDGNDNALITALRREGYYPDIDPPTLSQFGGDAPRGFQLDVTNPNADGDVYYSINGSDPRASGGAIAADAMLLPAGQSISLPADVSTVDFQVQSRVWDGTNWSALSDARFVTPGEVPLRITEIMYNPAAPNTAEIAAGFLNNDDFEFVELMNTGSSPLNLNGFQLSNGAEFTFAAQQLEPGAITVVARNTSALRARYGTDINIAGQFTRGGLANGGETLAISDATGRMVLSVPYNDAGSWPQSPDGVGASLTLRDPVNTTAAQLASPSRWIGSQDAGGTPGSIARTDAPAIVINEVLSNPADNDGSDAIELYNFGNSTVDLSGWYLSDSASALHKFQIPTGTRLAAGEYMVFDEDDFGNAALATAFSLSNDTSDDVWLTALGVDGRIRFIDDVHFVAAPLGESFGRIDVGDRHLVPQQTASLGQQNSIARVGSVVLSEIHYQGETPSAAALQIEPALTSDDLEFIELLNTSDTVVSLGDWRLRGGVDFDFPATAQLAANELVLVVHFDPNAADNATRRAAFLAHYGLADVRLFGGYAGQLDDLAERVRLLRQATVGQDASAYYLEDEAHYENFQPWPSTQASAGTSLQRISAALSGNRSFAWTSTDASPALSSLQPLPSGDIDANGTIDGRDIDRICLAIQQGDAEMRFDLDRNGSLNDADFDFLVRQILRTAPGDANLDGVFDSADLVAAFAVGTYEDEIAENSGWGSGDWNCDREFSTRDLVAAFQRGRYVP